MPSIEELHNQLHSQVQCMIDHIDDEMWSLNTQIEELNSQLRAKATEKNRLQYMLDVYDGRAIHESYNMIDYENSAIEYLAYNPNSNIRDIRSGVGYHDDTPKGRQRFTNMVQKLKRQNRILSEGSTRATVYHLHPNTRAAVS